MKIEIKNYKSCRADEGDAYSCTMYLDGKKAALVRYGGTGGPLDFDFSVAAGKDNKSWGGPMYDKFKGYVDGLPMEQTEIPDEDDPTGFWKMKPCMDTVVDGAINKMLEARELKRWCKTNVVYRFKGDPKGSYFQWKLKWTPQLAPVIRGKLETQGARQGKELEVIVNERFAA